jgi:nucleoside 2-deoxyribosyltransferase
MKKLYVCGSFRFTHDMDALERELKEERIQFQISKKTDSRGIQACLKKIDDADVVYVVNPRGYIGKSVSVDIGYAYAKNKAIYVMHGVDDPPVMNLISGVLSPKALIDFLNESVSKRH